MLPFCGFIFIIIWSVDECLGHYYLWAILNNAAVYTGVCSYLFEILFLIVLRIYPKEELLGCMVIPLDIWGAPILFFIEAVPFHIYTSSAQEFQIAQNLINVLFSVLLIVTILMDVCDTSL